MVKIRLEKVNKTFKPDVKVLKDIDLLIRDNEFLVLVGPSGCGKSTCLNIIAGLEQVTNGQIFFDELDVTMLPPKERRVAMVFQSYALYPHMNVKDNMSFSLRLAKTEKSIIDERVKIAADILGISELLNRKPKELSGGQRQRVALGRCIVRNPTVFLFDEPLSNLDAKLRTQMRGEIIKLQKQLKTTLVYVTHDQVEAMSMADRIVILFDGHVQQVGTPYEVYSSPNNKFVAGFIGSPMMNFIDASIEKQQGKIIFGEQEYMVKNELLEKIAKSSSNEIVFGIRPEHIEIRQRKEDLSSDADKNKTNSIYKMKITVVEYLGSETLLTMEFQDGISIMGIVSGFYEAKIGDDAFIRFPKERIHVFDKKNELNLIHSTLSTDLDKKKTIAINEEKSVQ